MPWNLVSCWSSSASAPVSARVSPSAIVPRRKLLRALMPSLADGARFSAALPKVSVDIAQVPLLAPQVIQRIGPKDLLQRGMDVLRHRVGVTTHVDRRAVMHPGGKLLARF